MTGKIVNIINFENIETIYQKRLRTLTVKVREVYTAVPEMNLQTVGLLVESQAYGAGRSRT